MPPDYWQTDNSNGLVMVIRNYSASRVLILTCSAPLVQTGERKQFSLFHHFMHLRLWLTIPGYSQGQGRPSCQKWRSKVKRFKQESAHAQQTDTRTHTDATKRILPCCGRWKHYVLVKVSLDDIFWAVNALWPICRRGDASPRATSCEKRRRLACRTTDRP